MHISDYPARCPNPRNPLIPSLVFFTRIWISGAYVEIFYDMTSYSTMIGAYSPNNIRAWNMWANKSLDSEVFCGVQGEFAFSHILLFTLWTITPSLQFTSHLALKKTVVYSHVTGLALWVCILGNRVVFSQTKHKVQVNSWWWTKFHILT